MVEITVKLQSQEGNPASAQATMKGCDVPIAVAAWVQDGDNVVAYNDDCPVSDELDSSPQNGEGSEEVLEQSGIDSQSTSDGAIAIKGSDDVTDSEIADFLKWMGCYFSFQDLKNGDVTCIEFEETKIDDDALRVLARTLERAGPGTDAIRYFCSRHQRLTSGGISHLSAALKTMKNLRTLTLVSTLLFGSHDRLSWNLLAEGIRGMSHLEELDLSCNALDDDKLDGLLAALNELHELQSLHLRLSELSEDGVKKLCETLQRLPKMRSLDLRGNTPVITYNCGVAKRLRELNQVAPKIVVEI